MSTGYTLYAADGVTVVGSGGSVANLSGTGYLKLN
jgi:hypothetical protein